MRNDNPNSDDEQMEQLTGYHVKMATSDDESYIQIKANSNVLIVFVAAMIYGFWASTSVYLNFTFF